MALSHDMWGCSYIFVALPPPSDAVPALWCVSTTVMCVAMCLLYVSAVKRRRVAVLHVSLAAFIRFSPFLFCGTPSACLHAHGITVCRAVTCATVVVSLRCRVG